MNKRVQAITTGRGAPLLQKGVTMRKYAIYGGVKAISLLMTITLIISCLFFGWLVICNAVGMDVPKLGSVRIYVVQSDSMMPVFLTNDAIFVTETAPEKLADGDIITFYAFESDTIITHRIIDVSQTEQGYEYSTKGDNNNVEDSFTTPDSRVIGRYFAKIPRFGAFLDMISSRPYIIAVVVAAVLALQLLLGAVEKWAAPIDELADQEYMKDGEQGNGIEK